MPARAPAQARPPVHRRTAHPGHLPVDRALRPQLHHRTNPLPDLTKRDWPCHSTSSSRSFVVASSMSFSPSRPSALAWLPGARPGPVAGPSQGRYHALARAIPWRERSASGTTVNQDQSGRACVPNGGCEDASPRHGPVITHPGDGRPERWIRCVIGADPRSAQSIAPAGSASSSCADTAQTGNDRPSPRKAGRCGSSASMSSHRRPPQ